jgi:hypothetical protein
MQLSCKRVKEKSSEPRQWLHYAGPYWSKQKDAIEEHDKICGLKKMLWLEHGR